MTNDTDSGIIVIEVKSMEFMTTKEAVEKWNISERRIRQLLQDGRIEGAVKVGNSWNIPILLLQRARHKVSAEIHDVSMHPGPKYDLLLQVQPLTAAVIAEYRSVRPEIG